MIHNIHTITIRRWGLIDSTENLSLLKKWYNIFPVSWFNVQKVVNEIGSQLNTGVDQIIVTESARLLLSNKIMKLQALYMGIYNLIVLKPDNDRWGLTKEKRTNLSEYLHKVEQTTGIIIKDLKGLEKLQSEIQRLVDKFQERFPVKVNKGESVPFLQYAYSVFMLAEQPYNPDMRLDEFIQLTVVADKKAKQLEKLKDGRKH